MSKQIEEINIKLRPSNNQGLMHDSRADARTCMEAINICIKKINEIVKIVNKIQAEPESALLQYRWAGQLSLSRFALTSAHLAVFFLSFIRGKNI